MSSVIVKNDRYTADPLYQWDVGQVLEIRGLSLPSVPEIHFTNGAMDRAIVRQVSIDDAGVITVEVPNSLLQKPYTITAYVCIYEDDTFKTLYSVNIPVKARPKPNDYTLENDDEVYSFNALENLVVNALTVFNEANAKYEEFNAKYSEADIKLNTATAQAIQAKTDLDSATKTYNNASGIIGNFVENYGDMIEILHSKANKPTVVSGILSASGWSGNTYSFEGTYPVATYDLEISLNSTATKSQAEAFNSAQIVGSGTTNIVTAFGDVPTVDIPIIIKAVTK